MACQASGMQGEALNVSCENKGTAYAQVREIVAKQGDRVLGRFEGGAYILPGARKAMAVKLEGALPGGPLQLAVTYDDGRSDAFDVTVGKR
jgi:fimbrial chaperone protein